MIRANDFLVEVAAGNYHVFPGESGVTQEESMLLLGDRSAGLVVTKIPQKDGSRFSIISARFKTPAEIVIRIGGAHGGRKPIWIGRRPSRDELLRLMADGKMVPGNSTFIAYKTHQFLNGARYYLVIARDGLNCFVDPSAFFPELVPEDGMGVFVESGKIGELGIGQVSGWVWVPTVVDYFSEVRLCCRCGMVSNFAKPKRSPWGAVSKLTEEIRERVLSGKVHKRGKANKRSGRPKKVPLLKDV